MHPLLTTLEWHGVVRPIGSYGALLALALLTGSALALRAGARAGWDLGALIAALAGAVAAGFVGAYLLSVAVLWPQLGSLAASLARPGIVFYGALIGGAAGLYGSARGFGLAPLATLDLMLPALPVGHAIGRIGCLLGGCCYGAPTELPWAIHYASVVVGPGPQQLAERAGRHPWPLYEAGLLLLLAAVFWAPRRFAGWPGRRAACYVALYALGRMWLEPLRGDRVRGLLWGGGFSTSQLISLLLLSAAGALVYVVSRRERRHPRAAS
ncbi:MAG: prolipoprotein diacylglyceryl transferase family protein [Polyangiales bacterium]